MSPRIFFGAALGLILANQAMAQAPQFPSYGQPQPIGSLYQSQAPQMPQFQQQQMPQSWTGNQIGGFTHWNGSNGGQVTCNRIGQMTFCN